MHEKLFQQMSMQIENNGRNIHHHTKSLMVCCVLSNKNRVKQTENGMCGVENPSDKFERTDAAFAPTVKRV